MSPVNQPPPVGPALDWPMLNVLLALCGLGLITLFSAGAESGELLVKQGWRLGIAFMVLLVFCQLPLRTLRRFSPYIYGAALVMLLVVLGFGLIGKGAQRWLALGGFRFQPSELMKLALPMMVAWLIARDALPVATWWRLMLAVVLVGLPVGLIVLQPDLGTALLVAAAGCSALFLGGLGWRLMGIGAAGVLAGLPFIWQFGLHEYQKQRVLSFLDPLADPQGSGYHSLQSLIAIGSGGASGKGWLQGSQSRLEFIPERTTDFIFSVYAEEFGLIGAMLLIGLYGFVIARGMLIAWNAPDSYSRLLAGSITATFFCYVFVNLGMVCGILPVVGVPLPLLSYGGTSLVTLMAGFGILMNIRRQIPSLFK